MYGFKTALSMMIPAVTLAGCFVLPEAKSPKTGAVATGEQLNIVDDVKVWTTTSKEKVGETVYKDSDGSTVGTSATYADKTTVHSMKVWYPVQGAQQLPDEDFFKIAGDQQAYDSTLAMRANGQKWNTRGKYTLVGGVAGMIAGFFVPNIYIKDLLVIGGGLAASGGWYMSYWGAKQMEPETHAVDRSIAERAAIQYNTQLSGHTAGLTVSRKF